jgi:AcrR family transcriptional regulator
VSNKRGPYSSPRQQQRRSRVLRVAGIQLERHGLAALTMQSIAEVSNVSTKTLYNLFGSRDLLLLEAASELLDNLEQSPAVLDSEPGIPRLLAYSEGAMKGIEHSPEYSRTIMTLLIRGDLDETTARARFGRLQRVTYNCLCTAAEQGELRADLNLLELSYLITGNQWGITLLWEKGLIRLEQLGPQTKLSHYLALTPLCRGKRKKIMEAKLQELLSHSAPITPHVLPQEGN